MDSDVNCSQLVIDLINIMLKAGADINSKDYFGETILYLAVERFKYLDTESAFNNFNESEKKEVTESIKKIFYHILESGADTNIANNDGETPLQIADEIKDKTLAKEIKKALKDHGATS